jgi:cytochrome b561
MIGLPLTGWAFVSAGWSIHDNAPLAVPTRYFGLFEVPHLFGLESAGADTREGAAEAAFTAHWMLAYAAIALAVLHVAAALKHHLFDRDAVLAHMVPGLPAPGETEPAPRNPVRLAILGLGLALTALAAIALVTSAAQFGANREAAPAPSTVVIAGEEAPVSESGEIVAEPQAPDAPAEVSAWTVDQRASAINFAYTYEDDSGATRFNGRFSRWRADIRFDPDNLGSSSVVVRIETASAATGVAAHDRALSGPEWFDASANPTATFLSTRIRARDGGYEARGDLTIKGQTRSVDLPFQLTIEGDRATVTGQVTIDRRDFGIGEGAGDELISRDIAINVRVDAARVR